METITFIIIFDFTYHKTVEITTSNVMSYIENTSEDCTEFDTTEWYYDSPYYKDEYTDDIEDDIINAYEEGVKKGIDFSSRYYNSIK